MLWIVLLIALIGINVLFGDLLPFRLQQIAFVALIVVLAVSVIASLLIDRQHLPIKGIRKHLEDVEKTIESETKDRP
jgi:hypothetical protein